MSQRHAVDEWEESSETLREKHAFFKEAKSNLKHTGRKEAKGDKKTKKTKRSEELLHVLRSRTASSGLLSCQRPAARKRKEKRGF